MPLILLTLCFTQQTFSLVSIPEISGSEIIAEEYALF